VLGAQDHDRRVASIGILAMVSAIVVGVAMVLMTKDSDRVAPRPTVASTPRVPPVIGAPLALRPVVEVPPVAKPQDCSSVRADAAAGPPAGM
jgi:hypothetical protein